MFMLKFFKKLKQKEKNWEKYKGKDDELEYYFDNEGKTIKSDGGEIESALKEYVYEFNPKKKIEKMGKVFSKYFSGGENIEDNITFEKYLWLQIFLQECDKRCPWKYKSKLKELKAEMNALLIDKEVKQEVKKMSGLYHQLLMTSEALSSTARKDITLVNHSIETIDYCIDSVKKKSTVFGEVQKFKAIHEKMKETHKEVKENLDRLLEVQKDNFLILLIYKVLEILKPHNVSEKARDYAAGIKPFRKF